MQQEMEGGDGSVICGISTIRYTNIYQNSVYENIQLTGVIRRY